VGIYSTQSDTIQKDRIVSASRRVGMPFLLEGKKGSSGGRLDATRARRGEFTDITKNKKGRDLLL